ncbi:MAG: sugar nucleotide-binding protein, partial [Acidimicrobiales bacterium]
MSKVLITGAAGQLGADCVLLYADQSVTAATRADLDVGDRAQVQQFVGDLNPDIVINAGAWTAVDACEADPDRALRDNAQAVGYLNDACLS